MKLPSELNFINPFPIVAGVKFPDYPREPKEKVFVVRDCYGYILAEYDERPDDEVIKKCFNLAAEASLDFARGGWGWETSYMANDDYARMMNQG